MDIAKLREPNARGQTMAEVAAESGSATLAETAVAHSKQHELSVLRALQHHCIGRSLCWPGWSGLGIPRVGFCAVLMMMMRMMMLRRRASRRGVMLRVMVTTTRQRAADLYSGLTQLAIRASWTKICHENRKDYRLEMSNLDLQ